MWNIIINIFYVSVHGMHPPFQLGEIKNFRKEFVGGI